MLLTKQNPVGIDVAIQKLQTYLYAKLLAKWGLQATTDSIDSYGRIYRNKREKGFVAEWFTDSGEYLEVLLDDSKAAVSFFGVSSRIEHSIGETVNLHLIYFVNLQKLKPDISHRADEEVRRDVLNLIGSGAYGCRYVSVDTFDEVALRDYTGMISAAQPRLDMHPFHTFKINFKYFYSINNC